MRKKARIDLLEIDEPKQREEESFKAEEGEAPSSEKKAFFKRFFHWKFFVFVLLPLFSFLGVLSAVTYVFLVLKEPPAVKKDEIKGAVAPTAPTLIELKDLSVVVSDSTGQDRVLLFSLVVMPAPGKEGNWSGEDLEMKALTIRIVRETPGSELLKPGGREEIKKRVYEYLEKERGDGSVHAVFVTSWTVI
ncbi:MAG: hypothetical protein N2572_04760 [Syntrophales bacterium]|nr:hypothetical protein [Syntrophales bacterium]